MRTIHSDQECDDRLRFVFSDTVVSFNVGAGLTWGELARRFSEIMDDHGDGPVGVAVTLGVRKVSRDAAGPGAGRVQRRLIRQNHS